MFFFPAHAMDMPFHCPVCGFSESSKSFILCVVYYLFMNIDKKYWIQIWTVWISNIPIGCTLTMCHGDVAGAGAVVLFAFALTQIDFLIIMRIMYTCGRHHRSFWINGVCCFPALWLNLFESGSLIYLHKCHLFASETVFI